MATTAGSLTHKNAGPTPLGKSILSAFNASSGALGTLRLINYRAYEYARARIRMHGRNSLSSAEPASLGHARREAAGLATGWSTRR
jgi:hypothetical protein